MRVLGSLLEEFCLPVLTFPPLKREKWSNEFMKLWSQQELRRPTASKDRVSWEAISGHRTDIVLLPTELKDFCINVKAFGDHIWDFIFINNSSPDNIWGNKSCQWELLWLIIQLYVGLPLKIKYKCLYLYLLYSLAVIYQPVERNDFRLNDQSTNQVGIQYTVKIFKVHFIFKA